MSHCAPAAREPVRFKFTPEARVGVQWLDALYLLAYMVYLLTYLLTYLHS